MEAISCCCSTISSFDLTGGGAWQKSISFPRSQPDGIYSETPVGENSFVFDGDRGVIYLVQGFRILAIDVNKGTVDSVFRQNFADLGDLVTYNGALYFTLQSNLGERYELQRTDSASMKTYTEVIELKPDTLDLKRYIVEGNYYSLEVETSGAPTLLLWSHHRPWYSTTEGTYMKISLPLK
jgi:hypothetical protein